MQIKDFRDSDIANMDWAERERKAALRSMNRIRVRKASTASSDWGIDVARRDARSVGAWLDGRGDLRTAWWNLYCRVYTAVMPDADLERAMHSFHKFHHALTLGWLSYVVSVEQAAMQIRQKGVFAAIKAAAINAAHAHH